MPSTPQKIEAVTTQLMEQSSFAGERHDCPRKIGTEKLEKNHLKKHDQLLRLHHGHTKHVNKNRFRREKIRQRRRHRRKNRSKITKTEDEMHGLLKHDLRGKGNSNEDLEQDRRLDQTSVKKQFKGNKKRTGKKVGNKRKRKETNIRNHSGDGHDNYHRKRIERKRTKSDKKQKQKDKSQKPDGFEEEKQNGENKSQSKKLTKNVKDKGDYSSKKAKRNKKNKNHNTKPKQQTKQQTKDAKAETNEQKHKHQPSEPVNKSPSNHQLRGPASVRVIQPETENSEQQAKDVKIQRGKPGRHRDVSKMYRYGGMPPQGQTRPNNNMAISRDYPYTYRRRPSFLRSPPGVARLEQALHPTLGRAIKKLKSSMQRVLQMVRDKVTKMQDHYGTVATDAKDEIMMVRKSLQEIAIQNDKAYDALLEVSSLVRYIHKRAYEHGRQAPAYMSLRNPQIASVDFRREVMLADQGATIAERALQNVMELKRKCTEQEERYKKLKNKYGLKHAEQELRDLIHKSRRTQRRLYGKIRSDVKARIRIYSQSVNGLGNNYFTARNLSNLAHKEIMNIRDMTMFNVRSRNKLMNSQSFLSSRNTSANLVAATSSLEDGLSYRSLQDYTNRAYRHSRRMQKLLDTEIKKHLIPKINRGKEFIKKSGHGSAKHQLNLVARRVLQLISKLEIKMDEIRIYLGNEDILKERCESLAAENSGLRDGDTIIDCEKYGVSIGIQSGSGDGEEEFISTSKPAKQTSLPSQLTTTPPPTEIEGSGDVDKDFEFEEDNKPTVDKVEEGGGGNWWGFLGDDPTPLNDVNIFKNGLRDKALDARRITEELNIRSIKTSQRFEKIYDKWTEIQRKIEKLDQYVKNASVLEKEWKVAKPFVVEATRKIKAVYKRIVNQDKDITNKTQRALEIAERHLQRVRNSKLQRDEHATPAPGNGDEFMAQLLASVNKATANTRAIGELTRDKTKPCMAVETTATRLRNNIAELRKKIDQARVITSSIPVTINLKGDNSLRIPLATLSNQKVPTTSFEMCIKPNGSDMMMLEFRNNNSITYKLEMEDRRPKLTLLNDDNTLIRSMTSSFELEHKYWHQLRITRYGQTIQLYTSRLHNGTRRGHNEVAAFPEIDPVQFPPSLAFVGGEPKQEASRYKGCIGDVRLDGVNVGLIQQSSGQSALQPCKSNCNIHKNLSIIFEGDGYVRFPLSILGFNPQYRVESLLIHFRTPQKEGIIFLLNNKLQDFQILISLSNGSIHMESRTRQGTTILRSTNNTYSDGASHVIAVTFAANKVDAKADGITGSFAERKSTQILTSTIDEGVFLGGWGSRSNVISGKTKLRPLMGCISLLKISNRVIPMFMQEESRNAYLGSCTENVWLKCARFTENSKPVRVPKLSEVIRIYLTISTSSRGTFLHFKRKNKFDIEFAIDKNEITVIEASRSDDETIPIISHHNQQWLTVIVVEEGTDVHIKLNGTQITIPHKGTGWFYTEESSSEYHITIGGKLKAETSDFTGEVASLIIDDSPFNLRSNATTNKLEGCEKQRFQIQNHVMEAENTDKPSC